MTGKTRIALAYLDQVKARRVLVVSTPEVIADRVWPKEIKTIGLDWKTLTLGTGDIEKRGSKLGKIPDTDKPVLVAINLEAFWRYPAQEKTNLRTGAITRLKFRGLRKAILDFRPDTVIIDEADKIANRTTEQSKFAHMLGAQPFVKRRLALTGTPVTEGVEDLFSIYKFIDPRIFGSAWSDFERRYIIKGGYGGYQIIGYRGEEEIKRIISETAYEIGKAEAIQLPPRRMKVIPVTLKPQTKKYYDEMKRNAIVQIEGPDEHGRQRSGAALARIVLTSLIRLLQISGGFLPVTDDEGKHILNFGDEKARKAKSIVEWHTKLTREPRQVVIFCKFLPDIDKLARMIPEAGVISGKVPYERRREAREKFRRGELKVLIIQISTSSRGISLTAGSVVIFYSVGHSLKDFAQARDRLHRTGQTRNVLEYLLQASRQEAEVFDALVNKQSIARRVTRLDYARDLLK